MTDPITPHDALLNALKAAGCSWGDTQAVRAAIGKFVVFRLDVVSEIGAAVDAAAKDKGIEMGAHGGELEYGVSQAIAMMNAEVGQSMGPRPAVILFARVRHPGDEKENP